MRGLAATTSLRDRTSPRSPPISEAPSDPEVLPFFPPLELLSGIFSFRLTPPPLLDLEISSSLFPFFLARPVKDRSRPSLPLTRFRICLCDSATNIPATSRQRSRPLFSLNCGSWYQPFQGRIPLILLSPPLCHQAMRRPLFQ